MSTCVLKQRPFTTDAFCGGPCTHGVAGDDPGTDGLVSWRSFWDRSKLYPAGCGCRISGKPRKYCEASGGPPQAPKPVAIGVRQLLVNILFVGTVYCAVVKGTDLFSIVTAPFHSRISMPWRLKKGVAIIVNTGRWSQGAVFHRGVDRVCPTHYWG